MTLIIAPWKMSDFEGAGIDRPGLEHVGFKVESVEAVKNRISRIARSQCRKCANASSAEPSEGERRLALIASCRHGQHQCSSPDGVFIDMSER